MVNKNLSTLLKVFESLEKQEKVSKDTSLKMRRLFKKLERAVARRDQEKARLLVAEICEVLLSFTNR